MDLGSLQNQNTNNSDAAISLTTCMTRASSFIYSNSSQPFQTTSAPKFIVINERKKRKKKSLAIPPTALNQKMSNSQSNFPTPDPLSNY